MEARAHGGDVDANVSVAGEDKTFIKAGDMHMTRSAQISIPISIHQFGTEQHGRMPHRCSSATSCNEISDNIRKRGSGHLTVDAVRNIMRSGCSYWLPCYEGRRSPLHS